MLAGEKPLSHARNEIHLDVRPYVPVEIPADPARDARVAAQRAEYARKAARALDRLISTRMQHIEEQMLRRVRAVATDVGTLLDQYAEEGLHHNRAYGVIDRSHAGAGIQCEACGDSPCTIDDVFLEKHTITPHYAVSLPTDGEMPADLCYGMDVPHVHGLHADQCERCQRPAASADHECLVKDGRCLVPGHAESRDARREAWFAGGDQP